ncbi:hypothetical protein Tco_0789682 [Tanacetum coccineum]
MSNLKFNETHNLVAFFEKPKESDGFKGIIDFLNASSIRYALTVNPSIYTSFIKQFWATAKAKTVNEEVHIQALVEGRKVIITETSRRKRGFSERVTPLFETMMVQAQEEGEGSEMPTIPQHTSTINQPSSSQPPKKQKPRKTKKQNIKVSQLSDPTQPMAYETKNVESVPIHSNDPLLSGEDRLKLNELRMHPTTVDELTLAQTLIKIKVLNPRLLQLLLQQLQLLLQNLRLEEIEVQELVNLQLHHHNHHNFHRPKDKGKSMIMKLAQRLQAEERGELTIEERLKLFVELMDKRKKHFEKLRAKEIRRKPPTKAQMRNQMYNSFVPMDTEVMERSKSQTEGSKKRTREELESDNSKKQKINENVEAEVDDEA